MPRLTLQERHEHEEFDRKHWNYHVRNGRGKIKPMSAKDVEKAMVRTSLEDVEKAVRAKLRADRELAAAMSGLPLGSERRKGIQACLKANVRKSEVARMLGVSPQAISQTMRVDDCPF